MQTRALLTWLLTKASPLRGRRAPGGRRVSGAGLAALTVALVFAGCAPATMRADASNVAAAQPRSVAAIPSSQLLQRGLASWYGPGFAGRRTANGEIFDPSELTAAHKELPFNTLVRVTNLRNQMSVVVRINDRGPFRPGRIIDLSRAGAEAINMVGSGVSEVTVEVLTLPEGVVRIEAADDLTGFQVASRFHPVGTLMALSPVGGGEPMVVRVVSQTLPIESPADILVGNELYEAVGSEARLHVN